MEAKTKSEAGYNILVDVVNPLMTIGSKLTALADAYPSDERVGAAEAALGRAWEIIDAAITLWMAEHGQRRVTAADLERLFG